MDNNLTEKYNILSDRRYLIPVLAIAMRVASSSTADASYIILAIYAMLGRQQVIQSLFLCWLFSMLNPMFASKGGFAALGRYTIIISAALSILYRSKFIKNHVIPIGLISLTLLLGVFLLLHTIIISSFVEISLLKSISWLFAMITLLAAWNGLTRYEHVQLEKQMFSGLIGVLLLSLPLLSSGLGYLGAGFMGIIGHPQSFGPTMSLLGAWLAGRALIERNYSWQKIGLLVICLVLIVLSASRTAGLALFVGLIVSLYLIAFINPTHFREIISRLTNGRIGVFLLVVGSFGLLLTPLLNSTIDKYLFSKAGGTTGIVNAATISRGNAVDAMTSNILKYPLTGIGFGLPSNLNDLDVQYDPMFGIPIGASIEKGVMPLAVMEELGIPGFLFVCIWFLVLIKKGLYCGFAELFVIITALTTNMCESTFFSAGGMGLLLINVVAWAATSKRTVINQENSYV